MLGLAAGRDLIRRPCGSGAGKGSAFAGDVQHVRSSHGDVAEDMWRGEMTLFCATVHCVHAGVGVARDMAWPNQGLHGVICSSLFGA